MDIQQPDQHTSGWITSLLRTAREAGVASDAPQLYRDFEDTVDQYIAALGDEEIDPTPFQQMFGVVVGEYLRKKLGMEWVIITDDYGTDLAIWAQAADGTDVYSCPIVVVGKRFSADYEKGQLESFCAQFLLVSTAQLQRT